MKALLRLWRNRGRRDWPFVVIGLGVVAMLIRETLEGVHSDPWWGKVLRLIAVDVWLGMGVILLMDKVRCRVCGEPIRVRENMVADAEGRRAHLSCPRSRR